MRSAKWILGLVVAVSALTGARADWSLDEMNRALDQTNFLLNSGCSGTLISVPERLILTNYHCIGALVTSFEKEISRGGFVKKVQVRRYGEVPVEQNSYDGYTKVGSASYIGEIAVEDQARDLAVVKLKGAIPHTYASPLLPDDSKVVRGERVFVVGNPALNYGSVVEGIVSSVNRTFEFSWTKNEKLPMIQFSGGTFGGNSGGALYNAKGQLIGVPAASFANANFIGLAVPVTIVKDFLREGCLASVFDAGADDAKCREVKAQEAKDEGRD